MRTSSQKVLISRSRSIIWHSCSWLPRATNNCCSYGGMFLEACSSMCYVPTLRGETSFLREARVESAVRIPVFVLLTEGIF